MRTLLIDFGNVVAFFDHRLAIEHLAALAAPGITESAIFDSIFGGTLEHNFDCGRISTHDFIAALRTLTQTTATDDALVLAWSDIFWPNDPMTSTLSHLRDAGCRLVLASNTNALHYDRISRQFAEPLGCFDELVLSFRAGVRKPDPAFFEACVAAARTPANECLFVDDKPEYVDAAKRCGIAAIRYESHDQFLRDLETRQIALD